MVHPRDGRVWATPVRGYWVVLAAVSREDPVLSIVLTMLVILAIAGVIVVYVAFPHRGEEVPHAPWVGEALRTGVNSLPTLDNQRAREHDDQPQHQRQ